jgi:hypothetical protein
MDPLDDRSHDQRLDDMPAHERDDDVADVLGGGLMAAGGTAVDRGTGERTGVAQGRGADDDESAAYGSQDGDDPLTDDALVPATDPDR